MGASLIQSLQNVKDFRAVHGRRYPLWLILLLIIMGTISGCKSYYAHLRIWITALRSVMQDARVKSKSVPFRHDVSASATKTRLWFISAAV